MTFIDDFDIVKLTGFEWDKGNRSKNRLKHNVEASECEEVFFNKPIIIFPDEKHSVLEKRYKVIGISTNGRKLSLAITIRNNRIRVIMARNQSRKEKALLNEERSKTN